MALSLYLFLLLWSQHFSIRVHQLKYILMVMVSKEAFIEIVKFMFMSPWSGVIGLGSIGFLYALIF